MRSLGVEVPDGGGCLGCDWHLKSTYYIEADALERVYI